MIVLCCKYPLHLCLPRELIQVNSNALNILPSYTDYFDLNTTTLALNTSSVWLGGAISGLFYGKVTDKIGRKDAMLYAALFTIFAAILQAASQNIAMFVIARIFIGMGVSASGTAGKFN
jgi:MFS family permease